MRDDLEAEKGDILHEVTLPKKKRCRTTYRAAQRFKRKENRRLEKARDKGYEVCSNHGVPTSMIARHKKPRHDLIVVLHLKSCGGAEKSLHGCLRCAIISGLCFWLMFLWMLSLLLYYWLRLKYYYVDPY